MRVCGLHCLKRWILRIYVELSIDPMKTQNQAVLEYFLHKTGDWSHFGEGELVVGTRGTGGRIKTVKNRWVNTVDSQGGLCSGGGMSGDCTDRS